MKEIKIQIEFEKDTEKRWGKILAFLEKLIDAELKRSNKRKESNEYKSEISEGRN